MRKRRKVLKVVGHYAVIKGEKVQIDPTKTNLPARCALALAEMSTGQRYELVQSGGGS